ncbi:MAG: helix-turn-helix domain-containing protein [Rhodospirillaceae bacterium]
MAKAAFSTIKAGLDDAVAFAKGEAARGRERKVQVDAVDVQATRKRLGLTQKDFAETLGIPLSTVRKWEQGERRPTGAARTLLLLVSKEPRAALRALGA